jgi:hypothetical protein
MLIADVPTGPLTAHGKLAYTDALAAVSSPRPGPAARLRECSAERELMLDCSVEDALPHIWWIQNVERCERKAEKVTVTPETSWTGTYVIRGRVFGVMPWQGTFRYLLHERGFHGEDAVRRRGGLHVNGGFTVEPRAGGCRIWHYERYLLPWLVAPLKPLITAYVRWTQRGEMRDLQRLITSTGREPVGATRATPLTWRAAAVGGRAGVQPPGCSV